MALLLVGVMLLAAPPPPPPPPLPAGVTELYADGMTDSTNTTWACVRGSYSIAHPSILRPQSFFFKELTVCKGHLPSRAFYPVRCTNTHRIISATDNPMRTAGAAIVTTPKNTLLAFAGGKSSCADGSVKNRILVRTSSDDGATWTNASWVDGAADNNVTGGYIAPVVDAVNGKVIMLYNRRFVETWQTSSSDEGKYKRTVAAATLACLV